MAAPVEMYLQFVLLSERTQKNVEKNGGNGRKGRGEKLIIQVLRAVGEGLERNASKRRRTATEGPVELKSCVLSATAFLRLRIRVLALHSYTQIHTTYGGCNLEQGVERNQRWKWRSDVQDRVLNLS